MLDTVYSIGKTSASDGDIDDLDVIHSGNNFERINIGGNSTQIQGPLLKVHNQVTRQENELKDCDYVFMVLNYI
jgi:hypothetical protein